MMQNESSNDGGSADGEREDTAAAASLRRDDDDAVDAAVDAVGDVAAVDASAEESAETLPADLLSASRITPEAEAREFASLTARELSDLHSDLYGTPPPSEHLIEEASIAMEMELGKIPPDEKRSLLRAQRVFPLAFITPSHATSFLASEGWDPRRAAQRMVKYWEAREAMLGDEAFDVSAFPSLNDDDLCRLNRRGIRTTGDQDVDGHILAVATVLLEGWHRRKMNELDMAVERIPPSERKALDDARKQWPELSAIDGVKLLFLRSADFDAQSAARRLVNYWEMKYYLFGRERGGEALTLDCLEEDCGADLVRTGMATLLPGSDKHGRVLVFTRPSFCPDLRGDALAQKKVLKIFWYILHAAMKEENKLGMNGIVHVNYAEGAAARVFCMDFVPRIFTLMMNCVPVCYRAFHQCDTRGGKFQTVIEQIGKVFLGRLLRLRARIHSGTEEHILAGLEECGIPRERLPDFMGGGLDHEYFDEWLKGERQSFRSGVVEQQQEG